MVRATSAVECNVTVRTIDVNEARAMYPTWDTLSDSEKAALIDSGEIPHDESHDRNTTCVGLHELLVDFLHPSQSAVVDTISLELGDSTAAPTESDTSLGNQVDSTEATLYTDNGDSIQIKTLVSSNVANGYTIEEVGLTTLNKLLNHSLLQNSIQKDESTEATITVTLSFSAQ